MNKLLSVFCASIFCAAFPLAAHAEVELIGTTQISFGQPLEAHYPNITHPDPSVKVMSFTGTASNFGTNTAILAIHFDYIDLNGIQQVIPLPNFYQNAIAPGAIDQVINAGPVQLPYCPAEVSIHFELLGPAEVEFQGLFDHTCIPVPEPSSMALASLGALALTLFGIRRRARR